MRQLDDETRRRLEAIAYAAGADPEQRAQARRQLDAATAGGRPREARRVAEVAEVAEVATEAESEAGADDQREPGGREHSPTLGRWHRLARGPGRLSAIITLVAIGAFAAGLVAEAAGSAMWSPAQTRASQGAAAGERTLAALLAAPQQPSDRVPDALGRPIQAESSRLVFTSRSLSADDAQTPWDVYAGSGTRRGTICLVATKDGLTSSTSCVPRAEALTGRVTLFAQTASGVLAVIVTDGIVEGRVTAAR